MKTVTINSNRDIFVYGSAYNLRTGEGQAINLNPTTWLKTKVLIHQGIYEYPAEIASWNTVQALAKAKILTVSSAHEGTPNNMEDSEAVQQVSTNSELEKKEKAADLKAKVRKQTMDDLADQALKATLEKMGGKNEKSN